MGFLGSMVKGALGAVTGGVGGAGGGIGGAIGGAVRGIQDRNKTKPVISEEGGVGGSRSAMGGRMKRKGFTRALRSSR